jgi:alginate O-acetyltransferase complex protein AlgI
MGFASATFALFLLLVYPAYWVLRSRYRKVLLLAASYGFYLLIDWRFAGLLLIPTVVDYVSARRIADASGLDERRRWLWASVVVDMGLLGIFKYLGFFVEGISRVSAFGGHRLSSHLLAIGVPVGVSFFTFRSLSYTIDVSRGLLNPCRSLLDYATFVAFFPLLGAGPIARARKVLPQIVKDRKFEFADLDEGVFRFLSGLAKKALVADPLGALVVGPVFASPEEYSTATLWLAAVSYAIQIYADFSGYSSMAIGIARLFGIKVPENFQFPYLATSPSEFWKRWHISLTSWFRDYLWWPLAHSLPFGGTIASRLRWSAALVAVFLVSGAWHGVGMTFIAWGLLHGASVAIEQQMRAGSGGDGTQADRLSLTLRSLLSAACTYLVVLFAWVFFRAPSLFAATRFIRMMFGSQGSQVVALGPWVLLAFVGFIADHLAGLIAERAPRSPWQLATSWRGAYAFGLIVLVWYAAPPSVPEFIYFSF